MYVSLVGRSNVGKSCLFNSILSHAGRASKVLKSIVSEIPGTTRDSKKGQFYLKGNRITLVDTGGFETILGNKKSINTFEQFEGIDKLSEKIERISKKEIINSNLIFFILDGNEGVTPLDIELGKILKKWIEKLKPIPEIKLIINKLEKKQKQKYYEKLSNCLSECYILNLGDPITVSAKEKQGIEKLTKIIISKLPRRDTKDLEEMAIMPPSLELKEEDYVEIEKNLDSEQIIELEKHYEIEKSLRVCASVSESYKPNEKWIKLLNNVCGVPFVSKEEEEYVVPSILSPGERLASLYLPGNPRVQEQEDNEEIGDDIVETSGVEFLEGFNHSQEQVPWDRYGKDCYGNGYSVEGDVKEAGVFEETGEMSVAFEKGVGVGEDFDEYVQCSRGVEEDREFLELGKEFEESEQVIKGPEETRRMVETTLEGEEFSVSEPTLGKDVDHTVQHTVEENFKEEDLGSGVNSGEHKVRHKVKLHDNVVNPVNVLVLGSVDSDRNKLLTLLCENYRESEISDTSPNWHSFYTQWPVKVGEDEINQPVEIVVSAPLNLGGGLGKMAVFQTLGLMRKCDFVVFCINSTEHTRKPLDGSKRVVLSKKEIAWLSRAVKLYKPITIAALVGNTNRVCKLSLTKEYPLSFEFKNVPIIPIQSRNLGNKSIENLKDRVISLLYRSKQMLDSSTLNAWLKAFVTKWPPPWKDGSKLNLKFAAQVRASPPTFVLWSNVYATFPQHYLRKLKLALSEEFGFLGIPLKFVLRTTFKSTPKTSRMKGLKLRRQLFDD